MGFAAATFSFPSSWGTAAGGPRFPRFPLPEHARPATPPESAVREAGAPGPAAAASLSACPGPPVPSPSHLAHGPLTDATFCVHSLPGGDASRGQRLSSGPTPTHAHTPEWPLQGGPSSAVALRPSGPPHSPGLSPVPSPPPLLPSARRPVRSPSPGTGRGQGHLLSFPEACA